MTTVSIKAGWSSGLRRQLQVLFSSGGVGSNPTPVKCSHHSCLRCIRFLYGMHYMNRGAMV